jgi:hypothetical protein
MEEGRKRKEAIGCNATGAVTVPAAKAGRFETFISL